MDAIVLPDALTIIKISGLSKLDLMEAKGNHLADISARIAECKGITSSQTSVVVQRDISLGNNSKKLAREAQQLASGKKKKKLA